MRRGTAVMMVFVVVLFSILACVRDASTPPPADSTKIWVSTKTPTQTQTEIPTSVPTMTSTPTPVCWVYFPSVMKDFGGQIVIDNSESERRYIEK